MTPQAAWLKRPTTIIGQDPLGSRYPSEDVYSKLLPGITNVTDRARYYSFYPWLIWAIEKHTGEIKNKPLFEIIRRADCLFTLIAVHHHRITPDTENLMHGGLTGSLKLSEVIDAHQENPQPIIISKYANREDSSDRYFKNRYGGLGQYYLGPLKNELILANNSKGEICYTEEKGSVVAEAFEAGIDRELFFDVLEKDSATYIELEQLVNFCPCQLDSGKIEQEVLINLFFNKSDVFFDADSENRRLSLIIILDLIKRVEHTDDALNFDRSDINIFLESVYTFNLPDLNNWNFETEELSNIAKNWRQYYSNELFSYPIETLFWAGLEKLRQENAFLKNGKSYGFWFADTFSSAIKFNYSDRLIDVIEQAKETLPPVEFSEEDSHELAILKKIEQTIRNGNSEIYLNNAVADSIRLLVTLIARWTEEDWQSSFEIKLSPQYQRNYPINLQSLFYYLQNDWRDFTVGEWIAWLASEWNVEAHINIALRKIRYETNERIKLIDSFKILPTERGLEVIEAPLPGFTSPRLKQTMQIIFDLGLIKSGDGSLHLSELGNKVLEENLYA